MKIKKGFGKNLEYEVNIDWKNTETKIEHDLWELKNKFDKEGKPINLMEWAKLCEDPTYRRIEKTTLSNGKWISTVWLGLNHNYGRGKPLIFETMVFLNKEDFGEIDMERYSTLKEAQRGHKRMIKKHGKT